MGAATSPGPKEYPMNTFHGTVKDGLIVLDVPAALPDGTRVTVLPIEKTQQVRGMREDEWPATPEGIAALLARMDEVEPGWLSPEDDAAWRATLRSERELEKSRFLEDADTLKRMWE